MEPLRASSQKPLDPEQCTFVYAQLGDCARAAILFDTQRGMPPASRARLQKIMDQHPGFPGKATFDNAPLRAKTSRIWIVRFFPGFFAVGEEERSQGSAKP
jgi:hypothetical protein